jgi:ATP-dependent Clp protease protease subunit
VPTSGRKKEDDIIEIPVPVRELFDNSLLKNHAFYLFGDIEEENIADAIKWIVYENSIKDGAELTLYINSQGGDLYQALGLIDMMRLSEKPIHTIGLGAVMSAAFLIFASGTKDYRYITKNCGIMCHQYSDTYEGKHHDLKSFTKEAELTNMRMLKILQEATGMSAREVKSKLLSPSDVWMSAEELVTLGVADSIL